MSVFFTVSRQFLSVAILLAAVAHSFTPSTSRVSNRQQSTTFDEFHSRTKLFSSAAAGMLPEGLVKTISKPGSGVRANRGDIATVKYSCYVPDGKPFAKATKQKLVRRDEAFEHHG
jgi:FKBP-type peptidyl-prolyl cis-trans isomerase